MELSEVQPVLAEAQKAVTARQEMYKGKGRQELRKELRAEADRERENACRAAARRRPSASAPPLNCEIRCERRLATRSTRLESPEAFGSRTHDSDEPVRRLLALPRRPPGLSA